MTSKVYQTVRVSLVAFALAGDPQLALGQSANFRAQGHYYTAKSAFESGRYGETISYLRKARDYLAGKSNLRLQFIFVRALYNDGRYREAQAEMKRFFDIYEGREKAEVFREEVDRLSMDEVREITKLLDNIDEKVASDVEGKKARAAHDAEVKKARAAQRNARRYGALATVNRVVSASSGTRYTVVKSEMESRRLVDVPSTRTYYYSPITYSEASGRYSFPYRNDYQTYTLRHGALGSPWNSSQNQSWSITFGDFVGVEVKDLLGPAGSAYFESGRLDRSQSSSRLKLVLVRFANTTGFLYLNTGTEEIAALTRAFEELRSIDQER